MSPTHAEDLLLYVANDAGYFCSHRLSLALAARERGWRVGVVLPEPLDDALSARLSHMGIEVHGYPFVRNGMNPFVELRSFVALWRIFRREKPSIVHLLTAKPVLYGGLVGRLAGVPRRIHAVLGLGWLFFSRRPSARAVRRLLTPAFRFALGGAGSTVIVQNPDDLEILRRRGMLDPGTLARAVLIRGSGVDPALYDGGSEPCEPPIVLFAGRLTRAKGLPEFAAAARLQLSRRANARFVVCGEIDYANPGHMKKETVEGWVADGILEWWGYQTDMAKVLRQASVVVLPSLYGEGVPKILIEAAAASRPLVATDTPGCREIVKHGENGLLVAVRDSAALAEAIDRLLVDPDSRGRMGRVGRTLVEREFALERVIARTLAVYAEGP